MQDRAISEDADIDRIAVPPHFFALEGSRAQLADTITAIGLGNESVESGAVVRVLLRSVDLQDAAVFVDLELNRIGGNDLHVAGY